MSKLVLYLPDGSLHDILLDKERLTIGRRPDNDICLPYPAVSGEHAAVVTILADSFLEDLGSTNGTLVNGQPVVKHFLRDNDHIDIGRQRLVYFMSDEHAAVPLAPDVLRRDVIGLHEQVERAREMRGEPRADLRGESRAELRAERAKPMAASGAAGPGTVDPLFPDDELLSDIQAAVFPGVEKVASRPGVLSVPTSGMTAAAATPAAGTPAAAMERHAATRTGPSVPPPATAGTAAAPQSTAAGRLASTWTPVPEVEGLPAEPTLPRPVPTPVVQPEAPMPVPSYRVRVLSGANAGRELTIAGDSVSVGSIGVQVARIAQRDGAWRLAALEGATPLALNGTAVPAAGAVLCPGDHFEVAGVELAFECS